MILSACDSSLGLGADRRSYPADRHLPQALAGWELNDTLFHPAGGYARQCN